MSEIAVSALGGLAGVVLAVGYVLYFVGTVRHEIIPNPITWLMWAYGTTLLTVIEADLNASWALLILPVTCSLCGIGVAVLCIRRGTMRWPAGPDMYAFYIDIVLTITYVSAWLLTLGHHLTAQQLVYATVTLLIVSNISTIVSFIPILRSTLRDPEQERALPWAVWTSSYLLLGVTTLYTHSGIDLVLFMLYPVSCVLLHGAVGLLSIPTLRYAWRTGS